MDKNNPLFWKAVKLGNVVELRDRLTSEDAKSRGKGPPLLYNVAEITELSELGGVCDWRLLKLEDWDEIQDILLMVKVVNGQMELRVYYQAPGEHLEVGNRQDLALSWLFWDESTVPSRADMIDVETLEYVPTFNREYADNGECNTFVKKGNLEFQCDCVMIPKQVGLSDHLLATVVEYSADTNRDDKEALIVEISERASTCGGFISLYWGGRIELEDCDVMAVDIKTAFH